MQGAGAQQDIATIAQLDQVDGAKPFPYHSWTGATQPQSTEEVAAQVQAEEAALSPSQQAAFQALQQQNGRRLMQGAGAQQDIATIAQLDQVDGAKPFPYHSWTGATQPQSTEEVAAQVQAEEAALSPSQQAAFQALQQQQQ
jgi:hypothetical protein